VNEQLTSKLDIQLTVRLFDVGPQSGIRGHPRLEPPTSWRAIVEEKVLRSMVIEQMKLAREGVCMSGTIAEEMIRICAEEITDRGTQQPSGVTHLNSKVLEEHIIYLSPWIPEVHAPFRRQRGRKARVQITDVRVQSLWHPSHQIGRKRPAMPWHGGKGRIAISTCVVLSPPVHQVEISTFCSQFIPHRPQLPAKRLEMIVHHAGLVILTDYELWVHEDC
jgi:hypothetical protein